MRVAQDRPGADRSETSPDRRSEILIVGGGIVGLLLAIGLGRAGVEVTVVDRDDPARTLAAPFDGRGFAIAYGSQRILESFGVWGRAAAYAAPILEIRVADGRSPLFLHYDHRDVGDQPFGWIVESRFLRRALLETLTELTQAGRIRHIAPLAVEGMRTAEGGISVRLADGRSLRARLLVAADGKASPMREAAGLRSFGHRYGQDAITVAIHHAHPHGGIAVEHFNPAGPLAILPMTDDAGGRPRSSIVWTETARDAAQLMALDDADFTRALAQRLGGYLGAIGLVSQRWRYPLEVRYAPWITAPRLALVGDSAHAIHPIAGQGLNLGIRDVGVLVRLVVEACRLGRDPGAPDLLARYRRERGFDILALTAMTDGLNRLFSNEVAPVKLARDLGLALVGTPALKPLRKVLMRHAMGLPIFA